MSESLLMSVGIFFVVFVVATITIWKTHPRPRKREGYRRDPLHNGSADGEHIAP